MIHITLLEVSEDRGDLVTCDAGQFEEEELVLSENVQYGTPGARKTPHAPLRKKRTN